MSGFARTVGRHPGPDNRVTIDYRGKDMGTVGLLAFTLAVLVEPSNGDRPGYDVGYAIGAYVVPLIIVGAILWGIFVGIRAFVRRIAKNRSELR